MERAQNLQAEGKHEEAAKIYREVIETKHGSSDMGERLDVMTAAIGLLRCRMEQNRYHEAADAMTIFIECAEGLHAEGSSPLTLPEIAGFYRLRAAAFEKLGDTTSAKRDWTRSREINDEVKRQVEEIERFEKMIETYPLSQSGRAE